MVSGVNRIEDIAEAGPLRREHGHPQDLPQLRPDRGGPGGPARQADRPAGLQLSPTRRSAVVEDAYSKAGLENALPLLDHRQKRGPNPGNRRAWKPQTEPSPQEKDQPAPRTCGPGFSTGTASSAGAKAAVSLILGREARTGWRWTCPGGAAAQDQRSSTERKDLRTKRPGPR